MKGRVKTSVFNTVVAPQWGAADAEIKVPSGENTEFKRSPFQAWSRSVYSHTCYTYCRGVLPCLFLPFRSMHLHFFQTLSRFFRSCVGPKNKIGHTAGYNSRVECLRNRNRPKNMTCGMMTCEMNSLEIE